VTVFSIGSFLFYLHNRDCWWFSKDIPCSDGIITRKDKFSTALYTAFIKKLKNYPKVAGEYPLSILENDKIYDVEYDSNEINSFYYSRAYKPELMEDTIRFRRTDGRVNLDSAHKSDVYQALKDDILNEVNKILPNDSSIARFIIDMLDNDELDFASLAKLESSLTSLRDKKAILSNITSES
jgi:hypothetical protein